MKNPFLTPTLVAVFLAFAVTGVQANQVKKSKSNVSNNKTNPTKGEVCDDGNTDEDCSKKANKDLNAEPYVETTQRDQASGMATGKRQHKPVSVSEAKPMAPRDAAPSSQGTGDASSATSSAPAGTASEGCCPGRCCPPEQADAAAASPIRESPTEPSRGATGNAAAIECPPGTVPSGSAGCVPAASSTQDMAINEKGLPGGTTKKETKSSK